MTEVTSVRAPAPRRQLSALKREPQRASRAHLSVSLTLSLLLSLSLSLSLSGCLQEQRGGPLVTALEPSVWEPSAQVSVRGRGFGLCTQERSPCLAAIAGQPVEVTAWTNELISLSLPSSLSPGEQLLTLSAERRPLLSAPVQINGPQLSRPLRDMGPLPQPQLDLGPPDDMSPPPPLDQALATLDLSYTPTSPDSEVRLEPSLRRGEGGEGLELRVLISLSDEVSGGVWGLASHLNYPAERLRYLGITSTESPRLKASTSARLPGRVMLYRVNPPQEVMTLRFEVLEPLEAMSEAELNALEPLELSFVERFSALRDLQHHPMNARWSGGALRYVVTP